MSNTSMGEGQNVPVPTGGFFYSQNCNFPEESFILSSPCNSDTLSFNGVFYFTYLYRFAFIEINYNPVKYDFLQHIQGKRL
jgi:hypothetical protein